MEFDTTGISVSRAKFFVTSTRGIKMLEYAEVLDPDYVLETCKKLFPRNTFEPLGNRY
jgi:hypothetical protein